MCAHVCRENDNLIVINVLMWCMLAKNHNANSSHVTFRTRYIIMRQF
jgi:hypothetical protein